MFAPNIYIYIERERERERERDRERDRERERERDRERERETERERDRERDREREINEIFITPLPFNAKLLSKNPYLNAHIEINFGKDRTEMCF